VTQLPERIDTFPAFLDWWEEAQGLDVQVQIDTWRSRYMAPWPELLQMQIEDYANEGIDWRQIAVDRVFPFIQHRLALMRQAHASLCRFLNSTHSRAVRRLGFDSPVLFVIYVGIGCGAGWATQFRETRAVLFGLENIAECGWVAPEAIQGLIAHELGHVAHAVWRERAGLTEGQGPWWQLYEEGFAQHCELLVQGTWHEVFGTGRGDWLEWCRDNRGLIAAEFLRTVDSGGDIRPFFGSWFDIAGRSQTGYYLGQAVVSRLVKRADLRQIAGLQAFEAACRPIVEGIARRGA
jgi:hypothetical protein